MKTFKELCSHYLAPFVLFLYILPFALWMWLATTYIPSGQAWSVFSTGLLLVILCALGMLLLLQTTDESSEAIEEMPHSESPEPEHALRTQLDESKAIIQQYSQEIAALREEAAVLKTQNTQVIDAYNAYRKEIEEKPSEVPQHVQQLQRQIEDQTHTIKEYEEKVFELKYQIEDLKYELSEVLSLNEALGKTQDK